MANKSVKSPMAVDKSNTPAWMRIVIIIVAISFVGGGIAVVAAGISGGGSAPQASQETTATADTITQQYQGRVDAALAATQSDPSNPDIVIEVGHAYFEWAVALYEGGQISASIPIWKSSVSYYDKVLAVDPSNDIALGNKAFALYYAQDDELAPAALQAFIDGAADNAALAAQVENAQGMLAEFETTTAP
ncbi:MAG: hypothetical protein Q7W51_06835 [Coriobacteriia bacterium]|nr:hypothetical protein [Coriobacteriia bacterium]